MFNVYVFSEFYMYKLTFYASKALVSKETIPSFLRLNSEVYNSYFFFKYN